MQLGEPQLNPLYRKRVEQLAVISKTYYNELKDTSISQDLSIEGKAQVIQGEIEGFSM